ncbi:unnamed protein product [Hydatigera taeniaeformis]|uniref:Twinkle protein, mitochondrial n=1 Tax=Hydatigena taeniaeformis TaxID=6205 RepID=A0A0R3WS99_HYDTA|nr:unnamed protein product [Hydatigera taeniaeformis]
MALRQYWNCLNVVGLSRTIPRPDISRFPPISCQKVLRKLPTLSEKPSQGDIVFLLPIDKQNDLDRLFTRWTDCLKTHGVDSYQLQAYVEAGVRAPSRGNSDVSTPRKKTRLNLSEKSSLDSAPTLFKALEDTVISLFKNEFTVAFVVAKNVSITTFISPFCLVPFDLRKKFLSTKLELPKRLSDQCGSKQPRSSLAFSNCSEFSESDSRLMYVDLTCDGKMDSQAFECLNQKQERRNSLNNISVLAFSFNCSGSELTLNSLNSTSSWVNVPLQCCRSPKASVCTHCVANMLAVMDFVILPMSYAFAPDLLVINVGGFTAKEVSRFQINFFISLHPRT